MRSHSCRPTYPPTRERSPAPRSLARRVSVCALFSLPTPNRCPPSFARPTPRRPGRRSSSSRQMRCRRSGVTSTSPRLPSWREPCLTGARRPRPDHAESRSLPSYAHPTPRWLGDKSSSSPAGCTAANSSRCAGRAAAGELWTSADDAEPWTTATKRGGLGRGATKGGDGYEQRLGEERAMVGC